MNNFSEIKLIVYDFDGVMTDNRVILDQEGKEAAIVNRGDGFAIAEISKLGIKQIIISTEKNPIVVYRAQKLHIEVINGVDDKKSVLEEYCKRNNIELNCTMFIGNDLNDLQCMRAVAYRGCPSDAEIEIKKISDWISNAKGGYGVVRELYRFLTNNFKNYDE